MAANGLGSVNVQKFGGLQLSADSADVGLERALSGENFELAQDGSFVRTRAGVVQLGFTTLLSGTHCVRMVPILDAAGYKMAAVSRDAAGVVYLDLINPSTGAITAVGNWAGTAGTYFDDAAVIGTPAAEMLFVAARQTLLRKYTGGVLSASVGKPRYVAVTPTSNRLIQANFLGAADSPTGALGSTSTVFLSDLGAPETYTATSYIHLRPGDGEQITGVVTYQNNWCVFKSSSMFMFYGEGTLPSGQPEFLYRRVDLSGAEATQGGIDSNQTVVATRRSMYYLGIDGIYATSGGPPSLVSGPLTELFRSNQITLSQGVSSLWAVDDKLYFATVLVSGGAPVVYVMDEANGAWTKWTSSLFTSASVYRMPFVSWQKQYSFAPGSGTSVFFAVSRQPYYTNDGTTTDAGSAIASSYQSGFSDLGAPSVKTVARSQVWGSGGVTYSIATDYNAADTGSALTLGVAPAVLTAQDRIARRGTQFSFKLSATSGAWRVNSVGLHVRQPRPVGSMP